MGVSPYIGSPGCDGRAAKRAGGGRGRVCVLLKRGICLILYLLPSKLSLWSSLCGKPWCWREARGPRSPSIETFLLLMRRISESTFYPPVSPIFHQKVSTQRTLDAYESLPSYMSVFGPGIPITQVSSRRLINNSKWDPIKMALSSWLGPSSLYLSRSLLLILTAFFFLKRNNAINSQHLIVKHRFWLLFNFTEATVHARLSPHS